jgi:acylglycerol lipase
VDFFNSVTETKEFKVIPNFIYGESLGGAIALMIHFLQPEKWNGMITAAAMGKLTDDVRPNWVLQQLLLVLAYLLPTWAITPTNGIWRNLSGMIGNESWPGRILRGVSASPWHSSER